jgi:hypothetical protein
MSSEEQLLIRLNALQNRVEQLELARRVMWTRIRRASVATAVVFVSMGGAAWAATGECPNGLPFCFAANAPARAAEVNHNFAQLKEWIEQKVGATGSSDVTITGGTVTAGAINGQTVGATAVTAQTVSAGTAAYVGALTVNQDFSANNNLWGSMQQMPQFDRRNAPEAPSGYMCPQGKYVCGIFVDHVGGEGWFEAEWWTYCCGL